MTAMTKGLLLAGFQLILVLSLVPKMLIDRANLPRVWAQTAPADPRLPVRGRYISLRVQAEVPPESPSLGARVTLTAENGRLTARTAQATAGLFVWRTVVAGGRQVAVLLQLPLDCFIPEHARDPSRLDPGEELWLEVSVPPAGPPRPLRLGIKRAGVLTPLDSR